SAWLVVVWGAHASRVLVAASRRNELFPISDLNVERSAFSACAFMIFLSTIASMKTSLIVTVLLAAAFVAAPSFAQETATTPASGKTSNTGQVPVPANPATETVPSAAAGQPSTADIQKMMQQMMEMSKTNDNHKLLASLDGNWD